MDKSTQEFKYAAFISYRHVDPDKKFAERLHSLLETYSAPGRLVREKGCPRQVGKLFRDQEELSASGDLSATIVEALRSSKFLIVVCSPRTPLSKWVAREIEVFQALGRGEQIRAVLIEGEPSESFPPLLLSRRKHSILQREEEIEPLAADIRAASVKESLRKLKTERLRLLAPMLGCDYDDLKQRDHEQQIHRQRLIAGGALGAAGIFAAISLYAWNQRNSAIHNYQQASAAADTLVDEVVAAVEPIAGTQVKTVDKILDSAGSVYAKLLESDQPPATRDGQGRMLNRFAEVYLDMNRSTAALRSAAQAIGTYRQLSQEDPANPGYRLRLATGLNRLGRVEAVQGHTDAALKHHLEAKGLLEPLLALRPDDGELVEETATNLGTLGMLCAKRQDKAGALRYFEQAVALRSRLLEWHPKNLTTVRWLAHDRSGLADAIDEQGDSERAFILHQQALEDLRHMAETTRDDARFQDALARAWLAVGYGHKEARRVFQADEAFEQARRIADRLAGLDSGNFKKHQLFLRAKLSIADLNRVGSLAEALTEQLRLNRELLGITQRLCDEDPANLECRDALITLYGQKGLALHALARQGIERSANTLAAAAALFKAVELGQPFVDSADLGAVTSLLSVSSDHYSLRMILLDLSRPVESVRHGVRANEIMLEAYTRLSQAYPDDREWVRERAKAFWLLAGQMYQAVRSGSLPADNLNRAADYLEQAFRLFDRLTEAAPPNAKDLDQYKTAVNMLGLVRLEQGDEAAATAAHEKAEAIRQRLDKLPPEPSKYAGTGLTSRAMDEISGGVGANATHRQALIKQSLSLMEEILASPEISKSLLDQPEQTLSVIQNLDSSQPGQNEQARAALQRGIRLLQAAIDAASANGTQTAKGPKPLPYPLPSGHVAQSDPEVTSLRKKQRAAFEVVLKDLPSPEQIESLESQRLLARASDVLSGWRSSEKLTAAQMVALRSIVDEDTPSAPTKALSNTKDQRDPGLLEAVRADLENTPKDHPDRDVRRQDLVFVLRELSGVYAARGDSTKAAECLDRARTLAAEVSADHPGSPELDAAEQLIASAAQKGQAEDLDGALADGRKAIEILQKLMEESPSKMPGGTDIVGLNLALAQSNQSYLLMLKRDYRQALASAQSAMDLNSLVADFALNMVFALLLNDQYEGAASLLDQFGTLETSDGKSFKEAVRHSIEDFRDKGIDHKDFGRLEKGLTAVNGMRSPYR